MFIMENRDAAMTEPALSTVRAYIPPKTNTLTRV